MLRLETSDSWILIKHQDHARLAGEFARHWNNRTFAPPEPFSSVETAVRCHDDSWSVPDENPDLTPEGRPSAFSETLVNTYDAFEEVELEDYLKVRGGATEAAAANDPYAAILISMHTVNLLTEQADLSGLSASELALHSSFIEGQKRRQQELAEQARSGLPAEALLPESLDRAFRFLQACDSLSLLLCVDFSRESQLRHAHPDRQGALQTIRYFPLGGRRYRLDPFPFDQAVLKCSVPAREVRQKSFSSVEEFRQLYHAAEPIEVVFHIEG